jgi:hypothetical protein
MKNKNVKKIAEDLHDTLDDPGFESFIAEQIISSVVFEEGPYFSLTTNDMTIDIWKKGNSYEIVKSVIPNSKKSTKDFKKTMKKKELIEELLRHIESFLD